MAVKACTTSYVYVELITGDNSKYDVVSGLFSGIIERNKEKFILLAGMSKNQTNIYNAAFYKFLMLEQLERDYKNMTFFTASEVDQKQALEILEGYFKELKEANFCIKSDANVIDISHYKEVPAEYVGGKKIENVGGTSGVGSFVPPANRYANTGRTYIHQPVVKKDPEPMLISRSTEVAKPTKKALAEMATKIDQIMAGTFQATVPELDASEAGTAAAKSYGDEGGYNRRYAGFNGGDYD